MHRVLEGIPISWKRLITTPSLQGNRPDIRFDVIHSHDWLTYPAGLHAKSVTGKPMVIHVHATEFDRSRGKPNPIVYGIEKTGWILRSHHLRERAYPACSYRELPSTALESYCRSQCSGTIKPGDRSHRGATRVLKIKWSLSLDE